MEGHVYVVEFGIGKVKIGCSINPVKRIRNLETQSGNKITNQFISEKCKNYRKLEVLALREFRKDRIIGEYITTNFKDVIDFLNSKELTKITEKDIELDKIRTEKFIDEVIRIDFEKTIKNQNTDVHCEYCMIPKNEFVDNSILTCENYSDLLDFLMDSNSEIEFKKTIKQCGLFNEKHYNEFKKICTDLGEWF